MRKELTSLRNMMKEKYIDVYIVPTNDFHGSEYINDFFKARSFVSGFTGSAGTLIVTLDDARLWTDGRYFLQADIELKSSGIYLMKDGEPSVDTISEYLEKTLQNGMRLGFDGRVISCALGQEYEKIALKKGAIVSANNDLVGEIWEDRPLLKGSKLWKLPESSYGIAFEDKLKEIRSQMRKKGADYLLITSLEENAWLYNLRGNDVEHTPVFFAFTLITENDIKLYIFDTDENKAIIPDEVTVLNYFDIYKDISSIDDSSAISANLSSASYSLINSIPDGCKVLNEPSPIVMLKAVKNDTEIAATKKAHINDGVAMVNFLYAIKNNLSDFDDELAASDYLASLRAKQKGFLDLSFDTICGYMDNGAIIHYSATPESSKTLAPKGFLLVDSGGQYINGTTDITRTIALGPLSDKMKQYYTAVLRAHIDLAKTKFKKGTTGIDLDKITRAPIHELGLNYNHGTGHGVGHVLAVHEGPQNISEKKGFQEFAAGMITSDEPGIYIAGEFGIRIENELLCIQCDPSDDFDMQFDNITICPYEREAIIVESLTPEELEYLNSYHKRTYELLSPFLPEHIKEWLKEITAPL